MKRYLSRSRTSRSSGFTLIELLVVIGIIAILAAVLFPAIGSAIRAAKRAKAQVTASSIQTAALAYYTEYSVYPVPSSAAAAQDYYIGDTSASDATAWKGLLYALCGNINPADSTTTAPGGAVANTRAITFLNMRSSDVDSAGGPKNPLPTNPTTSIYFNIAFDNDYDNIIGDSGSGTGAGYISGKLPDFANSTTTTMASMNNGVNGGVAVWANCNGSSSSKNPTFWVHTY